MLDFNNQKHKKHKRNQCQQHFVALAKMDLMQSQVFSVSPDKDRRKAEHKKNNECNSAACKHGANISKDREVCLQVLGHVSDFDQLCKLFCRNSDS